MDDCRYESFGKSVSECFFRFAFIIGFLFIVVFIGHLPNPIMSIPDVPAICGFFKVVPIITLTNHRNKMPVSLRVYFSKIVNIYVLMECYDNALVALAPMTALKAFHDFGNCIENSKLCCYFTNLLSELMFILEYPSNIGDGTLHDVLK